MVQHLIVPVDGSDASWRAADVAFSLARRADARVQIIEVISHEADVDDTAGRLAARLSQHDASGVVALTRAVVAAGSVAEAIAGEVDGHPESTVVMASHGRGRSAALMGSVAGELLGLVFGPIIVVGPHARTNDFSGPLIVAVDGSDASESVLPLAAAMGIELRSDPWIVEVADPDVEMGTDVNESAYPARLAQRLAKDSGHPVQFEVLHGHDVHDEISQFAESQQASLIIASTHARSGMSRFLIGSTASAIVRHAGCPVLLIRPPHLVAGNTADADQPNQQ